MYNMCVQNFSTNFQAKLRLSGDKGSITSEGKQKLRNIAEGIGREKDLIKININPQHEVNNFDTLLQNRALNSNDVLDHTHWRYIIADANLYGIKQPKQNIGMKVNGHSSIIEHPFQLIENYLINLKNNY